MNSSKIIEEYEKTFASSKGLHQRASKLLPSGINSDEMFTKPFPVYFDRASGSKKWDIDGREYVDYWMGHGSLLLGYNHPEIVKVVSDQVNKGTHYAACHEWEVKWGELVVRLVPCAEKVRFHSSGSEATMMAIRLARLLTGKEKAIKFEGHYHGWHDNVLPDFAEPSDKLKFPGVIQAVLNSIISCPPNELGAVEDAVKKDNDIACAIVEPTGGHFGAFPIKPGFLEGLREITKKHGIILIFDEVTSGFRCAPGGAQEYYNIIPDLATFGKILGGGLPAGAVAGRTDLMQLLAFGGESTSRIRHPGTFNANPLCASAGAATLEIVASGEDIKKANSTAEALRNRLRQVVRKHNLNWEISGEFSVFHIHTHADLELTNLIRCGMLLNGVTMPALFGYTSSAHSQDDVDKTAEALEKTIEMIEK